MLTFREYLIAEAEDAIMKADYLDRKGKMKAKLAKKDYDKDGKIETSKEEHRGVVDKAIKKAMKAKGKA